MSKEYDFEAMFNHSWEDSRAREVIKGEDDALNRHLDQCPNDSFEWVDKPEDSPVDCTCENCQHPKQDFQYGCGCLCECHRVYKPEELR
jgi:hypothetical protein